MIVACVNCVCPKLRATVVECTEPRIDRCVSAGYRVNPLAQVGDLETMKKTVVSFVVSAAMVMAPLPAMTQGTSTNTGTSTSKTTGPMPAAGAAGVKPAQDAGTTPPVWWWVGGGALIGLGVLLLTNSDDNNSHINPSTTTTTTATGTTS